MQRQNVSRLAIATERKSRKATPVAATTQKKTREDSYDEPKIYLCELWSAEAYT